MGGHKRFRRGHYGGYGQAGIPNRWVGGPSNAGGAPPRLKPIVTVAFIGALVVWSLLAWAGYMLVDPSLKWLATSTGILVESGKGIAAAAGVGKEVGSVAAGLEAGGFWEWATALLQVTLKPAIIFVWAIGALVLLAAPVILPRVALMLGRRG